MTKQEMEKVAHALAVFAVTGQQPGSEKSALDTAQLGARLQQYLADPYARNALIGAGAGGLVGLVQRRNKLRNALTYGMVGGLGGAGLTPMINWMQENHDKKDSGDDNRGVLGMVQDQLSRLGKRVGEDNPAFVETFGPSMPKNPDSNQSGWLPAGTADYGRKVMVAMNHPIESARRMYEAVQDPYTWQGLDKTPAGEVVRGLSTPDGRSDVLKAIINADRNSTEPVKQIGDAVGTAVAPYVNATSTGVKNTLTAGRTAGQLAGIVAKNTADGALAGVDALNSAVEKAPGVISDAAKATWNAERRHTPYTRPVFQASRNLGNRIGTRFADQINAAGSFFETPAKRPAGNTWRPPTGGTGR